MPPVARDFVVLARDIAGVLGLNLDLLGCLYVRNSLSCTW